MSPASKIATIVFIILLMAAALSTGARAEFSRVPSAGHLHPTIQLAPVDAKMCLTREGQKTRLEAKGYRQINFLTPPDAPIQIVRARNLNYAFELKVDACTAEVLASRSEYIGK